MHTGESDERLIHRLEAFSDIVIGFSLAQLGLSLTIPHHARDLFAHVGGASALFGFVITFALVCAVWWLHHRLFRHLFVPTKISIVANFAALGGVIFLMYSMQLMVHFGFTDPVAFPMYTGSYAWIMLLFTLIAWIGLRLRASQFTPEEKLHNVHFAVRLSIIGGWLLLITLATSVFGVRPGVAQWLFILLVVPLVINRMLVRKRLRAVNPPAA